MVRKSARAREREVLTNQRASSSSPSFFFSREKVKKPMVHSYALFGFRWSLSDSKHAFYFFLTNSFLVASQIFFAREETKAVCYHRDTLVCVWGRGGDYHVGHDTISFLRTQSFGVPTMRSERGCKSSARRTTTTTTRRSFFCIKSNSFSSSREKERKSRPTAFEVGILRRSK